MDKKKFVKEWIKDSKYDNEKLLNHHHDEASLIVQVKLAGSPQLTVEILKGDISAMTLWIHQWVTNEMDYNKIVNNKPYINSSDAETASRKLEEYNCAVKHISVVRDEKKKFLLELIDDYVNKIKDEELVEC